MLSHIPDTQGYGSVLTEIQAWHASRFGPWHTRDSQTPSGWPVIVSCLSNLGMVIYYSWQHVVENRLRRNASIMTASPQYTLNSPTFFIMQRAHSINVRFIHPATPFNGGVYGRVNSSTSLISLQGCHNANKVDRIKHMSWVLRRKNSALVVSKQPKQASLRSVWAPAYRHIWPNGDHFARWMKIITAHRWWRQRMHEGYQFCAPSLKAKTTSRRTSWRCRRSLIARSSSFDMIVHVNLQRLRSRYFTMIKKSSSRSPFRMRINLMAWKNGQFGLLWQSDATCFISPSLTSASEPKQQWRRSTSRTDCRCLRTKIKLRLRSSLYFD